MRISNSFKKSMLSFWRLFFCLHNYEVVDKTCTQRWGDASDQYVYIFHCTKCGKNKIQYIGYDGAYMVELLFRLIRYAAAIWLIVYVVTQFPVIG